MSDNNDFLFEITPAAKPTSAFRDSRAWAMRRDRNKFLVHPTPTQPMASRRNRVLFPKRGTVQSVPTELRHLVEWFEGLEEGRDRFRWTLRDSIDELLDGQRTGRWCYQHLTKTEKTYLGTAIEVNLTREFAIDDGHHLDWRIAGTDVDCKFSKDIGGWEIPMEMYVCESHGERSGKSDHPALLVWVNDDTSEWAAGLLTITDQRLRWKKTPDPKTVRGYNRDNKRRLDDGAMGDIYWLWGGLQRDLPTNLLLHMPQSTRSKILAPASSGQGRVNALFEHVQCQLINRQVVLAVGQQDDAPKRVRDARIALRSKGILILGHLHPHRDIADALGLPRPQKGAWLSVRVSDVPEPSGDRPTFRWDNNMWAVALPTESGFAPTI